MPLQKHRFCLVCLYQGEMWELKLAASKDNWITLLSKMFPYLNVLWVLFCKYIQVSLWTCFLKLRPSQPSHYHSHLKINTCTSEPWWMIGFMYCDAMCEINENKNVGLTIACIGPAACLVLTVPFTVRKKQTQTTNKHKMVLQDCSTVPSPHNVSLFICASSPCHHCFHTC